MTETDLKMTKNFVMTFDAVSNAAYCVSLRCPGAELERGGGGVSTTIPSGCGKPRGPAGRELKCYLYEAMTNFKAMFKIKTYKNQL